MLEIDASNPSQFIVYGRCGSGEMALPARLGHAWGSSGRAAFLRLWIFPFGSICTYLGTVRDISRSGASPMTGHKNRCYLFPHTNLGTLFYLQTHFGC